MLDEGLRGKVVIKLSTEWSLKYKQEHNRGPEAAKDLLNDPVKGLAFFLENSFARAGGEQAGYGIIASKALYSCIIDESSYEALMKQDNACDLVWKSFVLICNEKGFKKNDKLNEPVVKGLVKLAQKSSYLNPFKELSSKIPENMIEAFFLLRNIYGIGDKIASFNLRDVVSIMNMENKIKPQDQILIQPVDRWVNGIAGYIWGYLPERTPYWLVAYKIISECEKYGCLPTSFNQGAWKYGSSVIVDTKRITEVMSKDPQLK